MWVRRLRNFLSPFFICYVVGNPLRKRFLFLLEFAANWSYPIAFELYQGIQRRCSVKVKGVQGAIHYWNGHGLD